jgi:hypothetical protein
MFKKTFLLFFIIFISVAAFSQNVFLNVYLKNKVASPKSDTVYYDIKRQLTWNDFQGKPDYQNVGGAITSSGYAFDADMKMDSKGMYINIGVYIYFSKKESWKKPNITSDYHLLHEQRHFDITRLGADSFIKQLLSARITRENYSKVLDSIFDKAYTENLALQQKYDAESQHSLNRPQQLLWNDKVSADLKKLPTN